MYMFCVWSMLIDIQVPKKLERSLGELVITVARRASLTGAVICTTRVAICDSGGSSPVNKPIRVYTSGDRHSSVCSAGAKRARLTFSAEPYPSVR